VPAVPDQRAGVLAVELNGAMIGTITFDRRDAERPGHVVRGASEVELSYLFLPRVWGLGYAAEACTAALGWLAGALPGEPVLLCTQTANVRSMRLATRLGFTEVERFEEFGAGQWLGVRPTT
jgi:RimJ/RimL family protein N-acetyltransferase